MQNYSPKDFRALTWHDATPAFAGGTDTPRAYLERCLETIAQREPVVQAWVVMNETGAREAADASTARWKAGRQLPLIDGMPLGIKDLLETRDMPTQMGCKAYEGNFPKRDNPARGDPRTACGARAARGCRHRVCLARRGAVLDAR
ncbi:amidase family protein [Belnapia sp. F-4-1]|uniref:amidase family protein n=1 Tax=Belnapia sp. F-4-1 TaxID=1545443 RepID=UPI0005B7FF9F|nr:amidase family protein [Belnapia sp. F-4-1]